MHFDISRTMETECCLPSSLKIQFCWGTFVLASDRCCNLCNFDEVVSNKKHSQKWKPFLEGDEIGAFVTKYRGRFLRYEKNLLHRSRTSDIFETRKIMIQRITGGETP